MYQSPIVCSSSISTLCRTKRNRSDVATSTKDIFARLRAPGKSRSRSRVLLITSQSHDTKAPRKMLKRVCKPVQSCCTGVRKHDLTVPSSFCDCIARRLSPLMLLVKLRYSNFLAKQAQQHHNVTAATAVGLNDLEPELRCTLETIFLAQNTKLPLVRLWPKCEHMMPSR